MTPKSAAAAPPRQSLLRYIPLLLILFALALRLPGITWALPDQTRAYSYHPDESMVVGHALDLDPVAGRLDPNFYNYGSLALLIDSVVIRAVRAVHLVNTNDVALRPGGLALATGSELMTARLLSALLGAATAGFLYGIGCRLFTRAAGVIAALGYAVAPLAVQHAHFATVDIPATFFLAGSLYFAARYLTDDAKPVTLLWCGVWAGLAAATKYNGVLIVLSGAAAWWLVTPRKPIPLALLVGGTALGFVAGCPGIILNPSAVLRDVRFEAQHVATGHGDVFTGTPSGFVYHVFFNLRWALTLPLLVFCLICVGIAVARRRPADLVLAVFALPYYVLIGLAAVKFARYTLPLFPPLLLWAGAAWDGWRNINTTRGVRAFAVLAGIGALGFSVALDQNMTQPDSRDEAAAYLRSLPNVHYIGFAAGPWYYSPALDPLLAHPFPFVPQEAALHHEGVPLLIPTIKFDTDGQPLRSENGFLQPQEWVTTILTLPQPPDALAFGELHYANALRERNQGALSFLEQTNRLYPHHRNFVKPITLFGIALTTVRFSDGLPVQDLPHDMLYTNQGVSIWTK